MARKTKEDAEKTYFALLKSASELFTRQGVSKTTLNDIAKHAGMTRGALYWHFDNKDSIIESLWKEQMSAHAEQLTQTMKNLDSENPASHFRSILRNGLKEVFDTPSMSQAVRILLHCVEITDEQTPLRQFLEEKNRNLLAGVVSAITQLKAVSRIHSALSADILATALMAYLHGLIQYHLGKETDVDIAENAADMIDLFLDSFLVRED